MITVYRKMHNGKEFMKIMDGVHAISVSNGAIGKNVHNRIQYTNNKMIISDYLNNNDVSGPSDKTEFNKHFKAAILVFYQFFDVE